MVSKIFDLSNDNIADFELEVLGGIIDGIKNRSFDFRNEYYREFSNRFCENKLFKILKTKQGQPKNHKIVIRCNDKKIAKELLVFCSKYNIYVNNGYKLLTDKLDNLPITKAIDGCIVEMPIEDNYDKMKYLFDVIDCYIQKHTK